MLCSLPIPPLPSSAHFSSLVTSAVRVVDASMTSARRSPSLVRTCGELLAAHDLFIFDMDGVLWHGTNAIPGAADALRALRDANKRVRFVTNNASKHRSAYVDKLRKHGIDASLEEVYSSASSAAKVVKHTLRRSHAFVLGMEGVVRELEDVGVKVSGGHEYKPPATMEEAHHQELDLTVDAVVAGVDHNLNYMKIMHASFLLHAKGSDISFVATNLDAHGPTSNGRFAPGGGVSVMSVQTASGRKPDVVAGKPSQMILDLIMDEEPRIDRSRALMIGDRLDTVSLPLTIPWWINKQFTNNLMH